MTVKDSVNSFVTGGRGKGKNKNGIDGVTETQKKITNGNKITSLAARQGLPFAPDKLIG